MTDGYKAVYQQILAERWLSRTYGGKPHFW